VAFAAAPGTAHAGRSFFGWLQGTEVMPERSVELQNWIGEENRLDGVTPEVSLSTWGVGPLIGITDRLELGLPLEFVWSKTGAMPGKTAFADYGVELRYRFVTQDPQDAPAFAPLLRVSVKRLVLARDTMQPEIGLVGTYESGRVIAGYDLGFAAALTRDDHAFEVRPGAGVSILAVDELRFGAEVFGELPTKGDTGWLVAGPNLSWTHGRFWVSAAYGIGVYQIKDAPRMQWGIAF
jgi:hypothetical protein